MWEITWIHDNGPREHYRFHVAGWNTCGEVPREFRWSVPDLDDARYVAHKDADKGVRRAIRQARKAPSRRR